MTMLVSRMMNWITKYVRVSILGFLGCKKWFLQLRAKILQDENFFCSLWFFAPFVKNHTWIENLISRGFLHVYDIAFTWALQYILFLYLLKNFYLYTCTFLFSIHTILTFVSTVVSSILPKQAEDLYRIGSVLHKY